MHMYYVYNELVSRYKRVAVLLKIIKIRLTYGKLLADQAFV